MRLFEWDDAKAASNIEKHNLAFGRAVAVFLDPGVLVEDASRMEDPEPRCRAIGKMGSHVYVVIFTMRGDLYRIISARRANKSEMSRYGDR